MSSAVIAVIFSVLYYIVAIWLCRGIKLTPRYMALGGILSGITVILSCIMIPLPTGSAITLGASVPLLLLALIGDYRLAILSGWITGLLCMILVPAWQPVHWAQIFVEHLICFSCLGLAGIFGTDKRLKCVCGVVFAQIVKILAHILSGVVFFSANAWDGWGAWGYSISYNLSSGVPEAIIATIIILILPVQNLKQIWHNQIMTGEAHEHNR